MTTNDTTRVTAEALPEINRRRLLLGLAAASTIAANPSTAAASIAENPKLVSLAAELPAVAAAYHAMKALYHATTEEWNDKTPWAPDELTEPGTAWPTYDGSDKQPGDPEKVVLSGVFIREGEDHPRRIVVKGWHVEQDIYAARRAKAKAKKAGRQAAFKAAEADIARLKKLSAVVDAYEKEYREVNNAALAWHKAAWKEKDALHEALEMHIAAMMNEEDITVEGLLIKAQALAEWDRVGSKHFDRIPYRHGQDWHGKIAASILRHAKGGAA